MGVLGAGEELCDGAAGYFTWAQVYADGAAGECGEAHVFVVAGDKGDVAVGDEAAGFEEAVDFYGFDIAGDEEAVGAC